MIDTLYNFISPITPPSQSRITARLKLTNLTDTQFNELSTDVYDETMRRTDDSESIPFLLPVHVFHPKRNQARQKLSTLSYARFKDLCSDVYAELLNRYPVQDDRGINDRGTNDRGTRENKSPAQAERGTREAVANYNTNNPNTNNQSNTNINPYSSPIIQSQHPQTNISNIISDIGHDLDVQIQNLSTTSSSKIPSNPSDSAKILQLQKSLSTSQAEYQTLSQTYQELQSKYEKLQEDLHNINEDYKVQEQMSIDIRAEANGLLEEVKSLDLKNQQLNNQISILEEEKKSNKELIDNLNKQIESLSAKNPIKDNSVAGEEIPFNNTKSLGDALVIPSVPRPTFNDNSIVPKEKIDFYLQSVDELLLKSIHQPSSGVLLAMKNIVIACKSIAEQVGEPGDFEQDLAAGLTNLMQAAKNHAVVGNQDTRARILNTSNTLTCVIADLVNSFSNSVQSPVRDFMDDYLPDVDAPPSPYSQPVAQETATDLKHLQLFLEDKTDEIVQYIQHLLNAMRKPGPYGIEFTEIVDNIVNIVENVISKSKTSFTETNLETEASPILENLMIVNNQLNTIGLQMIQESTNNGLKQRMASASYDIAKYVKDVLNLLE